MSTSLELLHEMFDCGVGRSELVDIFGSDWVRRAEHAMASEARTEHLRLREDGVLALKVRAISGREASDMGADWAYWDGYSYLPLHLPIQGGEHWVTINHRDWIDQSVAYQKATQGDEDNV